MYSVRPVGTPRPRGHRALPQMMLQGSSTELCAEQPVANLHEAQHRKNDPKAPAPLDPHPQASHLQYQQHRQHLLSHPRVLPSKT